MSTPVQLGVILAAILFSYIWVSVPGLSYYSLQLAGVLIISYLILKRLGNTQLWQLAPRAMHLEIALLTIAFLISIGSTGNLNSFLFPLSYIHLFFLVMALNAPVSIVATLAIMLFHFGLSPDPTALQLSWLLSLPLVLVTFLFSRRQYEVAKAVEDEYLEDEALLSETETDLALFTATFLKPNLEKFRHLLRYPEYNAQVLRKQVEMMEEKLKELEKKTE